jgi:hypothetical protein
MPRAPGLAYIARMVSRVVSVWIVLWVVLTGGCSRDADSARPQLTSFAFLAANNPGLAADVSAAIDGTAVTATLPAGANIHALVASFATVGASAEVDGVLQASGATPHDFTAPLTYRLVAANGTAVDYVVAIHVLPATTKELTALAFLAARNPGLPSDVAAAIDGDAVTAIVPYGTPLTGLVATFVTTGERVTVAGAAQVSGATANDFSRAVVYRVTAMDGSTRDYTVTVLAPSPAKALTAFSFRKALNASLVADVTATITGNTIAATVPYGTPRGALIATFTATGASVSVAGTVQASGATPNDFTGPVVYRVAADDRSTVDYTVTVTFDPAPKDLTAFSFRRAQNPGLRGDVIAGITGTRVTAVVPAGTSRTALVATFATTGATVTVVGVPQTSAVTANDFTTPLIYRVTAADGGTRDYTVVVALESYVKASNTDAADLFGGSIALSADGSTLAVGAIQEASASGGVNGDQTDNTLLSAGAVYVYHRVGATWSQQAYLKASNPGELDSFGITLALSANGSTLAVGAEFEDSGATGINGNQRDESAPGSGAVYVFTRSGTTWSQQAYVKSSNTATGAQFGAWVSLSASGSILAVGAVRELSSTGAAYVFTRSGTTWSQQARLEASNAYLGDQFGGSVALSGDGSTLAVSANAESSRATGIDGDQDNDDASLSGAVYVFARSGATWAQQAYIKASNTGEVDFFGQVVALSFDGSTLAVSATSEDSAATGVGGNGSDNTATDSGAVYVFARVATTWHQQAYVKAPNTAAHDEFGTSLALSGDGSTLAVGAPFEDSTAIGIGGDLTDNTATDAGAVYLYTRSGETWSHRDYVKASNHEVGSVISWFAGEDHFGSAVALSSDGAILAVGAPAEDSQATGVGGDETDNFDFQSGAAYVFALD